MDKLIRFPRMTEKEFDSAVELTATFKAAVEETPPWYSTTQMLTAFLLATGLLSTHDFNQAFAISRPITGVIRLDDYSF